MICNKCNIDRVEQDFNFKSKKDNIRHSHCRECQKLYKRNHYQKDKETYKNKSIITNKSLQERNKKFVRDYLLLHPCVDCGNTDIRVLEFDHIKDKYMEVSNMVRRKISLEKISKEIEKCEVVCSNCHRIRTGTRAGWW